MVFPLTHQEFVSFFVLSTVYVYPKPYDVWTFSRNTGKWSNDAENQHQKWDLFNESICLQNIPSHSEESSDNMPCLSLGNEQEENAAANTKAFLSSPSIFHATGNALYHIAETSKSYDPVVLLQQAECVVLLSERIFTTVSPTFFNLWDYYLMWLVLFSSLFLKL